VTNEISEESMKRRRLNTDDFKKILKPKTLKGDKKNVVKNFIKAFRGFIV